MRMIIEIEKEKFQALTTLGKQHHISRTALIQQAIDQFLESFLKNQTPEDAFGILKKNHKIEGLSFQRRMRSEWDHRERRNI